MPATAFHEHAALDLADRFVRDVREVCAPFALRVTDEFALKLGPEPVDESVKTPTELALRRTLCG